MPHSMLRITPMLVSLVAAISCTAKPNAAEVEPPTATPVQAAATAQPAPLPPAEPAEPVRSDFWFSRSAEQGAVIVGRAPTGAQNLALDGVSLPQTEEGFFLMGFNRDAEATATLRWTMDGQPKSRILQVPAGKWEIERVNLSLPRGRKASQRRRAELNQINAARAQSHDVGGWQQDFIWPVKYWEIARGRISGRFGSQRYYRGVPGGYHTGLDIAAPTGTPYHAPADGVVTLAAQSPFSREGYLLMVDHGNGLNSAFVHSSKILVKKGDFVRQGQAIGLVGATGGATGPHLHWSMKWKAARVDPLLLLPRR